MSHTTAGRRTASVSLAAVGALVAATLSSSPASAVPPAAPTAPLASHANGTTVLLTWDRVSTATAYDVVVDNDPAFLSPEFSTRTVNTTAVPTVNLPVGTYHWRVRSIAGSEASDWSPGSFSPAPVDVPQPLAPVDGATLDQPEDPPLLTWSPVQGATEYVVEVDDESAFIEPKTYPATKSTSLVVPEPLGAKTWYWHVKATRGPGLVSAASPTRSFVINPLPAPVLTTPNDSPDEPVEDVVLDWEEVDGAAGYELQIANNVTFTDIKHERIGTSRILGTRYSPPRGLNNDQYYWRVRAVDLGGTTTPWTASQFNFKRQWPDRPWPVFPVQDGFPTAPDSVNHDPYDFPNKIVTTAAPYFQWSPVQHASHYQLDISTDANFTTFGSCRVVGTTFTPGNGVFSDTSLSRGSDEDCYLQEGSQLFWRVRPMDAPFNEPGFYDGIQGIYSPTQRFTWDPDYFTGLSPVGGITVDVPTLSWTPGVAAEKYRVELFKNGATTPFHAVTTYSTSYTPVDVELRPADGPFTWRLSALEAGGKSSALVSNSFNVSGVLPTTGAAPLTALSGRESDPATTRGPGLTWEPYPGADHYRVYLGDDDGTNFFWIPDSTESFEKRLRFPAFTDTGKRVLRPGRYKWVVAAFDAAGTRLGESAVNVFRIAGFPEISGQRIALDGKTLDDGGGCAARLDDGVTCADVPATPVLSWQGEPGMSFYVVYTSQDDKFTNLTETTRIPDTWNTRYAFTKSNQRPALPDNDSGVPYYWYIRPCKALGVCGPDPVSAATSRAENAFKKVSPKVALSSPASGSIVDTHEVTFDWDDYFDTNQATVWGGEKSPQSAKWYRLQVDDSNNFSAPFIDDVKVDQSTYTAFTKLYPEGPLHWRVAAIDGADNELNWSTPVQFEKRSPKLVPSAPLDGSTVAGTTPFRWASQAFAGAYEVEVYKNEDTTFSPTNRMFGIKVKTAAYAWNSPLPSSPQPYVWRVRRIDASGNAGPWSDVQRFTVDGGTLGLTGPTAGSQQPPNGSTLTWQPLPGATRYRVEIVSTATGQAQPTTVTVATAYAPVNNLATGGYRWTVTALDANGSSLSAAQSTFAVDAGLTASTAVAVSAPDGSAVGKTLVSTPPVWNQDGVVNSYQWLRDGSSISGATAPTYTLTVNDYTRAISLRVIGRKPGYTDGLSTSNQIGATAGGALQNTSAPAISGTAVSGSSLMVSTGTWTPSPSRYRYQWLRAGAPIPNATSSSYRLTPEDAGRNISVTVLASATGFNEGAAAAPAVAVPKLVSTTVATLSATRIKPGTRAKLGITVTVPGVTGPAGVIKVMDGTKVIKSLTLFPVKNGTVTVKLPKLKRGKHRIRAKYLGDARTQGSRSKGLRLSVLP